MSCSYKIMGKDGEDILEKYNIHYKLYGIAPSEFKKRELRVYHNLDEITRLLYRFSPKDQSASDLIKYIQDIIKENIIQASRVVRPHEHECPSCSCKPLKIISWDIEEAKKFLNIDPEEVKKIWVDC